MSYPGPGFIREERDVMYLILFSLHFFSVGIREEDLMEAVMVDDGFSYFEFRSALQQLLDRGWVLAKDREGDTLYYIGVAGAQLLDLMLKELPLSVRDRAEKASLQVIARLRRENTVQASHTQNADGTFTVHLCIRDERTDHLSLRVLAMTRRQCSIIEDNFKKRPQAFYRELLMLLSGSQPVE